MTDQRTCNIHPLEKTQSPCGMFDAPCSQCEYEMAELMEADQEAEFMARPQAERIEIYLDGAQVRSHLSCNGCPVIPAAPIDYSDIPF